MLQEVPLPFTPTVANCITWSSDGELAVAAGEFVHILVCSNYAGTLPVRVLIFQDPTPSSTPSRPREGCLGPCPYPRQSLHLGRVARARTS